MSSDLIYLISASAAAIAGLATAWVATVPLLRFKELRPLTPRDVAAEVTSGYQADIRAVERHARCGECRAECHRRDVVPLLSWRRGCRGCGTSMPIWVVMLHLGVPIGAALTVVSYRNSWVAVPLLWLLVVLSAAAFVDARIWLIPKRFVWVGASVGFVLITVVSLGIGRGDRIVWAVGGGLGAFALFGLMWFASPGKLGFGDVRLSALLGMYLGWIDVRLIFFGVLIGSLIGIVIGIWSLARGAGSRFAFGPALAAGTMLALWLHASLLAA